MGASIGKLSLILSADATQLGQDLGQASSKVSGFASSAAKQGGGGAGMASALLPKNMSSFGEKVSEKLLGGMSLGRTLVGGSVATAAIYGGFKIIEQVEATWAHMIELGKQANPALAERNVKAQKDLNAVLGQRTQFALRFDTEMTRLKADFLHTILPDAKEMGNAFAPLSAGARKIAEGVAPAAKTIIGPTMAGGMAAWNLGVYWPALMAGLPFMMGKTDPLKDSTNASGSQATMGGIADLAFSNWTRIASGPGGGQQPVLDKLDQIANNTKKDPPTKEAKRGF